MSFWFEWNWNYNEYFDFHQLVFIMIKDQRINHKTQQVKPIWLQSSKMIKILRTNSATLNKFHKCMRKSLAQSLEINIINMKIMQKFNSKAYCWWLCVQCASIYILADLCLYIWTCIYKVHFINVWKSWLWILIVVLPLKFIAEYIEIWSKIIYLSVYIPSS